MADTIITAASVIAAILAIGATLAAIYRWYLQTTNLSNEISHIKQENTLMCSTLSACLDGLIQLGANHSVPEAKEKLDNYLNEQAHK